MAGSAFSVYPSPHNIQRAVCMTREFRNILHCNRTVEVVYYGQFLSERSVPIWTTQEKKSH